MSKSTSSALRIVSLLACVGYFVIGRTCLLFPFSSFSMYAEPHVPDSDGLLRACHLLARPRAAAEPAPPFDVTELTSWDCEPWQEASERSIEELRCPYHVNVEDKIRRHIEGHSGHDPASQPIELVRRQWIFAPGRPAVTRDHHVAWCRAVRP